MKTLNIDIETRSSRDLVKAGVYKYIEDPYFTVLLFGFSVDHGPVECIECEKGEEIPPEIIQALQDPAVIKYAFNASFERICLSGFLGIKLSPVSWRCTMVRALYFGLPASLAAVGEVLGVEKQKLAEGKDLIKFFSTVCTSGEGNSQATVRGPQDDPEKWAAFVRYNIRDVETEMEIADMLDHYVPEEIWEQYELDQQINDRGIGIDLTFVRQAIRCDGELRGKYLDRAKELTELDNPNSPAQVKKWLQDKGVSVKSLGKKDVKSLIQESSGVVKEVLELRQHLSKSSVKKYNAMEACCCEDGRAHGVMQFYRANRTGRYASSLIQVQNLPQNHIPDLDDARNLIKSGCFEAAEMLYESVPDLLSQLIRTAIVPKDGCKFIVADFSAVEARALAWIAGEQWRMDVFAENKDIYCVSASRIYGVPVEKNGINGELRQKGKIAELALGYGGSVGAMEAMGARDIGLSEDELKEIVNSWRNSNRHIVQFWWDVDRAVKRAVKDAKPVRVKCFYFYCDGGYLIANLPSGRSLHYVRPRIERNRFFKETLTYEGIGSTKCWERIESYGPKVVENLTQAFCRDLLAEAMQRLTDAGYKIVMHVHDEVIIEAPLDADVETVCKIMAEPPAWAPGLGLNADGYECTYYQKS